jgi:peptidyl-prolyl cis-trans isomerase-like 3
MKYYDGCTFHRNIKQFIIQGGDPSGTGKNGHSADGTFIDDEIVELLKHDTRGVVAMANRGPNTNGSQFYITYKKAPHLDNVSSVFAR